MRMLMIAGLVLLCAPVLRAADDYKPGPDAMEKPGVPRGKVTEHIFEQSKVYPGTIRKFYVYVPAQYDGKSPASLMVFQDGHAYVNPKGDFRVPPSSTT